MKINVKKVRSKLKTMHLQNKIRIFHLLQKRLIVIAVYVNHLTDTLAWIGCHGCPRWYHT